jgi:hypothetical protein
VANHAPTALDLNNTTIAENQPAGTIVGKLTGVDPDGNATLVYSRASGQGSKHNNKFFVGPHNNLKAKAPIDFEANATLTVRLKVGDEHNASIEQIFVITVLDDPADNNTSQVDDNGTIPDHNGTVIDSNGTVPDGNGTFVDTNATLPDNNASVQAAYLSGQKGLNDGLVAHYPFEGNASDISGNGNHGMVYGATPVKDRYGLVNSAYSFDGLDDYIEINHSPSLNINGNSTISFWLKTEDFGGRPHATEAIISKKSNDASRGFAVYNDGNRPGRLNLRNRGIKGNNQFLTATANVSNDVWDNWIIVMNSSKAEWYRNGVLESTQLALDPGDTNSSEKLHIGHAHSWPAWRPTYFVGLLDDIRIWNRALSELEAKAVYLTPADSNGTHVDDNATVPDGNSTFVDTNATLPDVNATLPDNNSTVPDPISPDQNETIVEPHEPHPDGNGTVPDQNGTFVDDNATVPDGNGTHVDTNGTLPDSNATVPDPTPSDQNETMVEPHEPHPDGNGTVPDQNGTFVDHNQTHVDTNGTIPDTNATLPDSNATVPDPNTTPPEQNETIVEPHEPHPDGNGTVPDQNGTFVDHNQTHVDTNATIPDTNATIPDPNTTPPGQNETIVEPHEPHPDVNGTVPDQNGTFVDHNQTHVDTNGTIPDANATVPEHNETIVPPAAPTYRPIARTLRAETDAEGRLKLNGIVLTDGGVTVTEVGFILSKSLFAGLNSPGVVRVEGALSGDAFTASATMPDLGKRFYFRAYATNAKGTSLGSPKRFVVPEPALPAAWWASTEEATAGWRVSQWFGAFRPYGNGWLFHADLGWLYVQPDGVDGLWVWSKGKGWLWTNPGSYRYLYQADTHRWLYFLKRKDGQPRFYNHATGTVE